MQTEINKQLELAKSVLKETNQLFIEKECKQETIRYVFHVRPLIDPDAVTLKQKMYLSKKQYDKDSDKYICKLRKTKFHDINLSIDECIDEVVYDLINCGYCIKTEIDTIMRYYKPEDEICVDTEK